MNKKSVFPFIKHIACSLLILLLTTGAIDTKAQSNNPLRPALIVGITVEGLSDQYLTLLQNQLGQNGFKQLSANGIAIDNVVYGPGIDATAASAMLFTGAAPTFNGVPAATFFNTETSLPQLTLHDPSTLGNFTIETFSPSAIKVSTLADELKIATSGEGKIYSLAADPQQAIIAAGHAGDAACWIYDHTGNWASTTYYKDMPPMLSNRNYRMPLSSRLDTIKWTPLRPISSYPLISKTAKTKSFRIQYPAKDFNRFISFKNSPLGNKEITDAAIDLIKASKLGTSTSTDMILVDYIINPAASHLETLDTYLRLDNDIALLIETARQAAHGKQIAVFLVGLPTQHSSLIADSKKYRIPSGEFSVKKAKSLLEMYLMATHGNGQWLKGYHNKQFFLNRKLIAERSLNLAQFRTEVAEFLARMAGVSNVYTIDDVISSRVGDNPQLLKRNTSVKHSGDVMIEINPGWAIVDDEGVTVNSSPAAQRYDSPNIPAFLLLPNTSPKHITEPVDARSIVPTISRAIFLRNPNAAAAGAI